MQNDIYNFELSSANEMIVRTYECTRFKKLFRPATNGYLTVTNRRVLFHSTGKSLTGRSELINDMPIEDTVGVSAYIGLSINWMLFILFAIGLYICTALLDAILPDFFTSWIFAFLLILPMCIAWLFKSNILNEQLKDQVLDIIEKQLQGRVTINQENLTQMYYIQIPFWIGVAIIIWYVSFDTRIISQIPFLNYVLLIAGYFLIYISTIGRQQSFSLMIGSRATKNAGIYIPGDSFRLIFSRDSTALDSLSATPATDAEHVVREIGAMLLDLRQMGDMGIAKWKK